MLANDAIDFEALMGKALGGDERAYATVLNETARLLRPFLGKRISEASQVEDVLQEILLSIHKARGTYDPSRPYKPWAYAIAKFRLTDYLRSVYSDKLRHAKDLSAAEHVSATEDVTEEGISYESIKSEIERLPTKQAQILTMIHHDGFTSKEVAARIGMTESAVKVAAHRAYKVLKVRLQQ